jgi:hypothetical protein
MGVHLLAWYTSLSLCNRRGVLLAGLFRLISAVSDTLQKPSPALYTKSGRHARRRLIRLKRHYDSTVLARTWRDEGGGCFWFRSMIRTKGTVLVEISSYAGDLRE